MDMMKIRILLLFLLIISNQLFAQVHVLESYPLGQDFYVGGLNGLEKEMVGIVKKEGLLPCENTDENYTVNILVYADASIKYIKDFDTIKIKKSKCAYDFSRKVIPHLKRWLPARIDGNPINAVTKISVQPFILYYSKDDPKDNKVISPRYKRGTNDFAEDIKRIMQDFIERNEDRKTFLTFVVNEDGIMQNFGIEGSFTDAEKRRMIDRFSRIKGKWEPATFNGIPRRVYMRQPIFQFFDIQFEIENINPEAKHSHFSGFQ